MPTPKHPLFDRTALQRSPLVGVVADSGQIARLAVRAGADFLLCLSAGVYRSHGVSALAAALPFANSNDLTEQLLCRHVLPGAGALLVIAGNLDPDPTCLLAERLDR